MGVNSEMDRASHALSAPRFTSRDQPQWSTSGLIAPLTVNRNFVLLLMLFLFFLLLGEKVRG